MITTHTIEFLRSIFGPLPYFLCQFGFFTKMFVSMNFFMIMAGQAFTKFVFVVIFRSIPEIDDNFYAFFFYTLISLISLLSALSRLYLPGRPILYHVSKIFQ